MLWPNPHPVLSCDCISDLWIVNKWNEMKKNDIIERYSHIMQRSVTQ
jgi:hypothetical protein